MALNEKSGAVNTQLRFPLIEQVISEKEVFETIQGLNCLRFQYCSAMGESEVLDNESNQVVSDGIDVAINLMETLYQLCSSEETELQEVV